MNKKTKAKRARSIRFDEDDLAKAKKFNLDLSEIARESLRRAIEILEEERKKTA